VTVPLIVFPDVVPDLIAGLQSELGAAVKVAGRVPRPRPATPLVVLRRAGGVETGIVDRPRIDAQVWHDDEPAATALAGRVRTWLLGTPGRVVGVRAASTFSGLIPIPDPESQQERVLLTVELAVRGEAPA
jgi:hypothetical protein